MVDNSPRPIAASHVLHRLLVPRHPPSALNNLTTKMLASTVQFSNNDHPNPPLPHPPPTPTRGRPAVCDTGSGDHPRNPSPQACSLRTQQGAQHQTPPRDHDTFHTGTNTGRTRAQPRHRIRLASVSAKMIERESLLRKEVIQPHLPVRLPCYDFVPIASPTFDHSLPKRG